MPARIFEFLSNWMKIGLDPIAFVIDCIDFLAISVFLDSADLPALFGKVRL